MITASHQLQVQQKGKSRDLFWKIGSIKGACHPKMGTIKDKKMVETY